MKLETGGLQLSLHCFLGNQSYGDCFNFSNTLKHTFFFTKNKDLFFFKYRPPCRVKCCFLIIFASHFCFWPDNLRVVPCFFPPTSGPAWVWQNFRGLGHIHRGIDPSNKAVPRESWVRVWSFWTGRIMLGGLKKPNFWEPKNGIGTFWKHFFYFRNPTTPKLSENLFFVVFGTSFQTTHFFISNIRPSAE